MFPVKQSCIVCFMLPGAGSEYQAIAGAARLFGPENRFAQVP